MSKVRLTLIENALVMPMLGTMDAFASGVFRDGICLLDSLLYRGIPVIPRPPARKLSGTYIFGGYLFGHYGHFLLESLSRSYAVRQCPDDFPVLFMSPATDVFTFQSQIFKALKQRNDIILVKTPLEVEKLIYAPPGCDLSPLFISDEQLEALGRISVPEFRPERKIWLSRSKFKGGGVENEAAIEKELAGCGWEIIHPQDLGIYEQIRLIAGSGLVSGFAGTAFFNVLLAERVHGRFMVISRSARVNPTIPFFLDRKQVRHEEYAFPVEYSSGKGAGQRYFMPDTGPLLELLRKAEP